MSETAVIDELNQDKTALASTTPCNNNSPIMIALAIIIASLMIPIGILA